MNIFKHSLKLLLFLICFGVLINSNMLSLGQTAEDNVSIAAEYRFTSGWYPRMCQIDNDLYVAYFTGNVSIAVIHLDTNTIEGPKSVIPNGDRPMMVYDEASDRLIITFNSEGLGNGQAIGMAHVSRSQILNASAWFVQYNLLGPIPQPHGDVGIWEPYLFPFGSDSGQYVLGYSNQSIHDPQNSLDSDNYTWTWGGTPVNQKIDLQWLHWNGSQYSANFIGAISENVGGSGKNIHHKDGMVSTVNLTNNADNNSYLAVFEAFPPGKGNTVAITKFTLSNSTGLQTEWRTTLTEDNANVPYITTFNDGYIVSYRHKYMDPDGGERLGLIGIQANGEIFSDPIHAPESVPSVWESITTLKNGSLFLAAGDRNTNQIIIQHLIPKLVYSADISSYPSWLLGIVGLIGVWLILQKKVNKKSKKGY